MKEHQVKLIDNTYGRDEARDLLLALINDKIRFLKQRIFSLEERIGCNTDNLEKRVHELKQEKYRLVQEFEKLEKLDCSVEIDCHVHLKIHDEERVIV